ncbi:MAG: DUF2207 domain-containing protein [Armatimonadota bacterium]|nr:DUF2207 domain-containing protein [Armatimonadota bacterium]MDR7450843.1 DUF2207 domain-containing protein [Armatimonadota bacterium]MDR7465764.1 DUF2207 domain-containing protein [Armatimonadota bacterium]MDR7493672.1 DUF2207 domain-containing protein [Armatimonadota bacterium]MDR7499079.1 DUF2207 domain-containing protein [Armatimonadota bacterium]
MTALRRVAPLALLLVLAASAAWAKSYDHPLIEQTFRLRPNGDAEVEEVRTFRFDGTFSWASITRDISGQYGRYTLEYHGVWDADTRQALRHVVKRDGDKVELTWIYDAQDTTKRFLIRYRIGGAVQRYEDVAQFYWQAVEGDHAPIGRVRITLLPPAPSVALFKVFVHSRAAPGSLDLAPDGSRAVVTQHGIPETSFVEVRALLDPATFPQARVQGGQTYKSLLQDERRQAGRELRQRRLFLAGVGLAVFITLLLIVGYIWTYRRYGKEPPVAYDGLYEREPPRPLPPAVVPAIMTQGKVNRNDLPKGFAATLLEAARLGYLEIEEVQDQGLLGTGLFKDTDLIYRLTSKGVDLLDGGRPFTPPADERPLLPFEIAVLQAVFKHAGDGTVATSDQIEAWGKRIVGSKSNFLRFVESWGPQLRGWFERTFFKLDDATSERAKVIYIGLTVVGLLLAFFVGMGVSLFFAGPVGAVLLYLAVRSLSRRTPEAALEVRRWEAFRRFMTDFSAMKEAGPQLLHLWEHYLVYATALGVADRLLNNLKLVAAELHQPVTSPRWFRSPSMGRGLAGSVGSLESLTRSFQNFQNLSRALSSSTRSGGGFSGGGGGGGGGGSSRAG